MLKNLLIAIMIIVFLPTILSSCTTPSSLNKEASDVFEKAPEELLKPPKELITIKQKETHTVKDIILVMNTVGVNYVYAKQNENQLKSLIKWLRTQQEIYKVDK